MKINWNHKLEETPLKISNLLNRIFALKSLLVLSIFFSFQSFAQSTIHLIPDSDKNILSKEDKIKNSIIIKEIIVFQEIPTFPKFYITGNPVKDESDYAAKKMKWIAENQLTYDLLQPKSLPSADQEMIIDSKKTLKKL